MAIITFRIIVGIFAKLQLLTNHMRTNFVRWLDEQSTTLSRLSLPFQARVVLTSKLGSGYITDHQKNIQE